MQPPAIACTKRGRRPPLVRTAGLAGEAQYDVSGQIARLTRASVSLYGVTSPFTAATLTDDRGRFTFKKIRQGAYTIAVFSPADGEARRTIEVGPSNADSRGRVALHLDFKEADFVLKDAVRRRHAVSAKQLSVPEKAAREYADAQKALARHDVEAAEKHPKCAVEIAPQFSGRPGTRWAPSRIRQLGGSSAPRSASAKPWRRTPRRSSRW